MASEHFLPVVDALMKNKDSNASLLSKILSIHIITIQKILDTMEIYGLVVSQEKRGIGRPSKIYSYKSGKININIDELIRLYQKKSHTIREKGNSNVTFSYNIDKEIINAILIGGKKGKKITVDEKMGKLLWLLSPPDSQGESIENLAHHSKIPLIDAISFIDEMKKLDIIEEIK